MELKLADLLTVPGAAVVIGILVQLLKRYVAEQSVPILAILGGVAIALLATLALGQREVMALGNAALTGFLGGSAAVGFYELQKPLGLLGKKS